MGAKNELTLSNFLHGRFIEIEIETSRLIAIETPEQVVKSVKS